MRIFCECVYMLAHKACVYNAHTYACTVVGPAREEEGRSLVFLRQSCSASSPLSTFFRQVPVLLSSLPP